MNYKDDQYKLISQAVMEQLGIEEAEDIEEVPIEQISDEIVDLKEQLVIKETNIHELEIIIEHLSDRVEMLERMFFEFKSQKR